MTLSPDRLREIRAAGLDALSRLQMTNGEFPTYWSQSRQMTRQCYVESPFVTGMIILALEHFPASRQLQIIRRQALQYILSKRPVDGHFRFLNQGINPDLDDMALLNWILQSHFPNFADWQGLAKQMAGYCSDAGVFRTWVGDVEPNPVDVAVNINVLRFLLKNRIHCAATEAFIRNCLVSRPLDDPTFYYESGLFPLYLTLTLPGEVRQRIIADIRAGVIARLLARTEKPRTLLDDILLLYCGSQLGLPEQCLQSLTARVVAYQSSYGAWPSSAGFRAFNYWGSPALSTALALQSLSAAPPVFPLYRA